MTKREFVEQTAAKLLGQGRFAFNSDERICLYRDPTGAKCAIGIWIPDEMYDPLFEKNLASMLMECFPKVDALLGDLVPSGSIAFFNWLQRVLHDDLATNGFPLLTIPEALALFDASEFAAE